MRMFSPLLVDAIKGPPTGEPRAVGKEGSVEVLSLLPPESVFPGMVHGLPTSQSLGGIYQE